MMLKCLKHAALVGALTFTAFAAQAEDANTVVASVNGKDITLGHLVDSYTKLPEQYRTLPDDVLWQGVLDQLIQQTLLAQTADTENTKRIQLALQNEERQLRAASAIDHISAAAVTDEALSKAYTEAYATGAGMEFNASHILVETEEAAAELVTQARDDVNFGGLAREHSTGPSGPNGGELGWFGEGMMVPEFEMAVKGMSVGEVSDPVQTQFGWHVIKLNESRAKQAPELEKVRAELELQLQTQAVEARLAELMGEAEITRKSAQDIDPALLKDDSLLD